MLEYAKIILPKVSFSRDLFRKELKKCIDWIETDQLKDLYAWCIQKFQKMYPNILAEAFADIAA